MKTLLLASSFVLGLTNAVFAQTLTLNIATSSGEGLMRGAIFNNQAAFDAVKSVADVTATATAGVTVLKFTDLAAGTYGIAVFHDKNENAKLDSNLLGAPKEPFGFSNNPKIKFSAPTFDAFKFHFDGTSQEMNITLNGG